MIGTAWGVYDTNILSVIEPVKIISVSWKWLDEKEIFVKTLCDYPDYKPGELQDKELCKDVWELLDKAEVVIGHNSDSFDCKVINTRFIANGLTAPSDFQTIDTLKAAKKYFRFSSNKLDELGNYLQEGRKASTGGFSLWLGCMKGDKKSWDKMKQYNAQDIQVLENVYLRLRPFIKDHVSMFKESGVCTVCGSKDIQSRGYRMTKAGRYKRFHCQSCSSWSSGQYERSKKGGADMDEDVN